MTQEIEVATLDATGGTWTGPAVVHPEGSRSLEDWAVGHRDWLERTLLDRGAVLLRGFDVDSPARFRSVSDALLGAPMEYLYRSTPRTSVEQRIYTATEYPPSSSIPMHNENAYQRDWPMKLVFCCLEPAAAGGETPLARTADVTRRVGDSLVSTFATRKVRYVRNYGHDVDLPWQTVFQTESKTEVESYCAAHSIEWRWLPGDRLRTEQVCQGVARHPVTGERLLFNQAHLFHVSSLGPDEQAAMLEMFDEADLPRNAYFGDGQAMDEQILAQVRSSFDAESLAFPWQKGDVLLVDNMLVAHGRRPFTGGRRVLVAMGEPFSACGAATGL